MKLLNLFKRRQPASVARDRLHILLSHERSATANSDLVALLRDEILVVVARHVPGAVNHVDVTMDRGEKVSTLQIDVQIPV